MPRFRFTLRRMMIAVAILAAALGLESMRRRRNLFSALATEHDFSQQTSEDEAAALSADARLFKYYGFLQQAELITISEGIHRERAKYFARLATKYRTAASYPWLSVEPDPPEPQ